MDAEIRHDAKAGRFYVQGDGVTAHLEYARVDEKTLDYRHTFVPVARRGRGLGKQIVHFALRYARDNGLKVVPTCPFVAATIQQEPSFHEIVAE